MKQQKLYKCPKCGDVETTNTKLCVCGGTYQPMTIRACIAYEEAKKHRILRGIKLSEDRAIYGSTIFPDAEPNYLAIPVMVKHMNDEIRSKYGERPRWRHE